MTKHIASPKRGLKSIIAIMLMFGLQYPAKAQDPFMLGFSDCWQFVFEIHVASWTWIAPGEFPEVQVIGHFATTTSPNPPFVEVLPVFTSNNTVLGTDVYSEFFKLALPGLYTNTTLHGFIDIDGTEHEAFTTAIACVI